MPTPQENTKKELSRADLWAAVELFVGEQRELNAPDDDLKELVPRSMPRNLLDAMAAVAYFRRGDDYRGGWMPSSQRTGTNVLIAENEIVMMQVVQNLFRLPVLTLQGAEDGQLNPRGRDPLVWAAKITMAILMGNYETLVAKDDAEREAARVEFYKKQRAKNPHQPTSM